MITKVVRRRFSDLSVEEVGDLWVLAQVKVINKYMYVCAYMIFIVLRYPFLSLPQKVGKCIEQAYDGSSLTFAIQDGAAAGQSVPHVHIHVLPRRAGDFEPPDKASVKREESCTGSGITIHSYIIQTRRTLRGRLP